MNNNLFATFSLSFVGLALAASTAACSAEVDETSTAESDLTEAQVCKDRGCWPGSDGRPMRCAVSPTQPTRPICVDACWKVACAPGFDGTEMRCIVDPTNKRFPLCVPAAPGPGATEADPCKNVACSPGFDGTPMRCAVAPAKPRVPVCVPEVSGAR